MLAEIVSIGIGYLLGSFSPAYFFGRMKGLDIRNEGMKNAGTRNVKLVLGVGYAVPTALYDVFKGIISYLLAMLLGTTIFFAYMAGFAALLGHKYPFYLQFHGGQGSATFVGIILYAIWQLLKESWLIFLLTAIIVLIAGLFFFISHVDTIPGIIGVPLFIGSLWGYYPDSPHTLPLTIIMGFMLVIYFIDIISRKKMVITDETFLTHKWRVITRPFAVLLLVFYELFSKEVCLFLIGIVALVFISLDLMRLYHRKVGDYFQTQAKGLFKKGEEHKFSSMTSFLVAAFICVLLFEKEVAYVSILFVVFGDLSAKLFGLAFGKHPLFHKTYEGTLAYLGAVIMCIYLVYPWMSIPLWILLIGGIAAPIIEVLPVAINDNFIVPLVSGTLITVVRFFL